MAFHLLKQFNRMSRRPGVQVAEFTVPDVRAVVEQLLGLHGDFELDLIDLVVMEIG